MRWRPRQAVENRGRGALALVDVFTGHVADQHGEGDVVKRRKPELCGEPIQVGNDTGAVRGEYAR